MKKRKSVLDSLNQMGGFFSNFSFKGAGSKFGDFGGTLSEFEEAEKFKLFRIRTAESRFTGLSEGQRKIADDTLAALEDQLKVLQPGGKLRTGVEKTITNLRSAIEAADAKTADETAFNNLKNILQDLEENGTEAQRVLAPFAKTTNLITNAFSEMGLAINKLKKGTTGLTSITDNVRATGEAFLGAAGVLALGELDRGKLGDEFGTYKNAAEQMLGKDAVARILGSADATTISDDQLKQLGDALVAEANRLQEIEKRMMTGRINLQAELLETQRGTPKLLADQLAKGAKVLDIEEQIFAITANRDVLISKGAQENFIQIEQENAKLRVLEAQLQVAKDEASLLMELKQGVLDTFASGLQTALDGLIQGTVTVKEAFANMTKSVLQMISKILAKMAALAILEFMMPGTDFTKFLAGGGYMQGRGQRKVPGYRHGGIVKEPTYMVGEGRFNEAVVPLPDGRSIPVQMKGGAGGSTVVNVNISGDGQATSNMTSNGGQRAQDLGKAVSAAVQEEMLKQQRPGGLLSPIGGPS